MLLKAALLPDDRGLAAWRELRPRLDFGALDNAAWPALPMLYRNLAVLDPGDEALPRLRGIRRYLWAQNQLLISEVMPLVAALEAAGIATMLLKGGALLSMLDDPGLRPMRDLDVLVPEAECGRAIDLLAEAGAMPESGVGQAWVRWVFASSRAGWGFITPGGRQLDLHWHAMLESRQAGADAALWAGATDAELGGVRTSVPARADQLLHTVVHAMRWDLRPSYRWVVDAWLLLSQPVDFDRLVDQARRRRASVQLHAGLAYLARSFSAPVPPEVIATLDPRRGSLIERAELRARLRSPQEQTRFARAVVDHQSQMRRRVAPGVRLGPVRRLLISLDELGSSDPLDSGRPPLALGDRVHLGRSGAPGRYVARGTGLPVDDGCWTVGREARFVIPIAGPPGRARILSIGGWPFVAAAHPSQRLAVVANGRVVARRTDAGDGSLRRCTIVLPEPVMRGRTRLDLRLRTPDARSPRSLGLGEDVRELGWFLTDIAIAAAEPYILGTELLFGDEGNAGPYLAGGWSEAEPGGRWTVGHSATLLLRVDRPAEALRLEFSAAAHTANAGGATPAATVVVNGCPHATVRLDGAIADGGIRVALGGVSAGDEIALSFDVANPVAPRDLGLGEDGRQLGLHMRRLVLADQAAGRDAQPVVAGAAGGRG